MTVQFSALPAPLQARTFIEPNSGCWLWTGPTIRGYGYISIDGKSRITHRVAYETFYQLPKELHHTCKTRQCCNPAHLQPVTAKQHKSFHDHWQSKKTHCPQGHLYSPANTYVYTMKNGWKTRTCRICAREKVRRHKIKVSKLVHPSTLAAFALDQTSKTVPHPAHKPCNCHRSTCSPRNWQRHSVSRYSAPRPKPRSASWKAAPQPAP